MIKRKWSLFGFALGLILLGLVLIPGLSTAPHHSIAEHAATRAQLAQYVNALNLFYGEYGDFPTFMQERETVELSSFPTAEQFIEVLSGRDQNGDVSTAYGNYRGIAFYAFAPGELFMSEELGYRMLVDRSGNTNIVICLDHDGDGMVRVPTEEGPTLIRTRVACYTIPSESYPSVQTW